MPDDIDATPESGLWKDYLNRKSVSKIAAVIGQTMNSFDQPSFVNAVLSESFQQLELKQRIGRIAACLKEYLPPQYRRVMKIFTEVAPKLGGFENWALMTYIENYGLDHFEESIAAMKALTRHSSAEFAIRPYMVRYEEEMLKILRAWALDEDEHVRRLAAEGSRPRGVWTIHLESFKKNPHPVLKLLEKLKADPSLYVRKAVANNLNDISKDHPDLVIETSKKWMKDNHKHTDWIVRHACRSLIKKGDPRVFPIFGFTTSPRIALGKFKIVPARPKIGKALLLSFELESKAKRRQKLAIDYVIHYVKKDGKLSPKVFKLAEKTLNAGDKIAISTRHSFEDRSTRKHYAGKHRLEVIINGDVIRTTDFQLSR